MGDDVFGLLYAELHVPEVPHHLARDCCGRLSRRRDHHGQHEQVCVQQLHLRRLLALVAPLPPCLDPAVPVRAAGRACEAAGGGVAYLRLHRPLARPRAPLARLGPPQLLLHLPRGLLVSLLPWPFVPCVAPDLVVGSVVHPRRCPQRLPPHGVQPRHSVRVQRQLRLPLLLPPPISWLLDLVRHCYRQPHRVLVAVLRGDADDADARAREGVRQAQTVLSSPQLNQAQTETPGKLSCLLHSNMKIFHVKGCVQHCASAVLNLPM
mmetsp:Transcript_12725/g.30341  ORF Transcript_12725/g.30341 Transcript_12725/m.30341 type:complete len:265 (+) Transcript_12725:1123-1917(+)